MNVLIVFCHPEPRSFNGAMKEIAVRSLEGLGHRVEVSDLYAEGFDPVERPSHYPQRAEHTVFAPLTEQRHAFNQQTLPDDVQREIARLERADLIILQFPLWWHGLPAMLKGWFDRVMVYGGLYSGSMRYDRGRLVGKRALCLVTTGSPTEAFTRHGRGGDMAALMWPTHCSLYYLGLEVLPPQVVYGVQGGGLSYQAEGEFREHIEHAKQAWAERLGRLEEAKPIPFSGWQDWDEQGVLKAEHPLYWRP
ncbi:NAD(P)H-dependent oxidoreductase [Halomonas sp. ML-15]|uniref:NAD(P)H-dependent oxidoreductase n=1 Tax=Halomonas sp. ML-15 TaxID=2773305 RepID=UPI001745E80F|nr:NAD(P)H-dependent oxidoreductase [Halomonas sp. ML-15]MBD3897237.1 NAD(P)H-dependent oxidoreductase [Halomonas sp. ML-15]